MVITIIAEPRSGSTNLANWFLDKKEFTILYEPITSPDKKWFMNNTLPENWKYSTEHLLVKETHVVGSNFQNLISISNKIIILYREDYQKQCESWLNSTITNNWDKSWIHNPNYIKNRDTTYFNNMKLDFKNQFLSKDYFKISYEELYYNNGFQKIVEYINLNSIKNENFPYGKKYRISDNKPKTII